MVDYYNKSEWKFPRSIIEENNTTLNVNRILYFFRQIRKIIKATISFVMSACLSIHPSAWNNSTPQGQIFMRFDVF